MCGNVASNAAAGTKITMLASWSTATSTCQPCRQAAAASQLLSPSPLHLLLLLLLLPLLLPVPPPPPLLLPLLRLNPNLALPSPAISLPSHPPPIPCRKPWVWSQWAPAMRPAQQRLGRRWAPM